MVSEITIGGVGVEQRNCQELAKYPGNKTAVMCSRAGCGGEFHQAESDSQIRCLVCGKDYDPPFMDYMEPGVKDLFAPAVEAPVDGGLRSRGEGEADAQEVQPPTPETAGPPKPVEPVDTAPSEVHRVGKYALKFKKDRTVPKKCQFASVAPSRFRFRNSVWVGEGGVRGVGMGAQRRILWCGSLDRRTGRWRSSPLPGSAATGPGARAS